MPKWFAALALGLVSTGPARAAEPASASAPVVRISAIEARLWYQFGGRLSKNLLAGKEPFAGWNTIIGEGSAEEPASDLLVDVLMTGGGADEASIDDPLDIWVTNKAGKVLARRRVGNMLLPREGALHNPLWLQDVACAGKLTFHAKFRKQTRTASLSLDCGE